MCVFDEITVHKGFAEDTSYDCTSCHHKCCVDSYPIGLLPREAKQLLQHHPMPQITKDVDGLPIFRIYRTYKCPYFSKDGKCILHEPSMTLKPLSCILYPLIYWNFAEKEWLVVIEPCSDGFRWWDGQPIPHEMLQHQVKLSKEKIGHLPRFLGDVADPDFPYVGITEQRVKMELQFKNQLLKSSRPITMMIEFLKVNESRLRPLRLQAIDFTPALDFEEKLCKDEAYWCQKFLQALKNVMTWLGFSAKYLQFKPVTSVLLRLLALELQCRQVLEKSDDVVTALCNESKQSSLIWRFIDDFAWSLPDSVGSFFWKEKLETSEWKVITKKKNGNRHLRTLLKRMAMPIKMRQMPMWQGNHNV